MHVLESRVDTSDSVFRVNEARLRGLVDELRARTDQNRHGGGPKYLERHRAQGKLPVRERIERLIDRGSPFLELSALAGWGMYDDDAPGAGLVTGIGRISGHEALVVANDATVKGGTYYPVTVKKHLRAQQIAFENRLPCVYLVDSGGAFLPMQADVFPDREHFGRIFFNQARMSAERIPQIAVVMGSCTAGGAYVPAMSDETIIVNGTGTIFLGGPPLLKAATGEEVTAEELGGADVHTRLSGVADYFAEDDDQALDICRTIVSTLPPTKRTPAGLVSPEEPKYDPAEIYGIVNADIRKPYDAREIIAPACRQTFVAPGGDRVTDSSTRPDRTRRHGGAGEGGDDGPRQGLGDRAGAGARRGAGGVLPPVRPSLQSRSCRAVIARPRGERQRHRRQREGHASDVGRPCASGRRAVRAHQRPGMALRSCRAGDGDDCADAPVQAVGGQASGVRSQVLRDLSDP